MSKDEFRIDEEPSFLIGYLKGLADRLGGDDAPVLMAAVKYISDNTPKDKLPSFPVTDFKPFVDYPWTPEEEARWDKIKPKAMYTDDAGNDHERER